MSLSEPVGAVGKAHALLGASGASRWLNCLPSARAEEGIPDRSSGFADEGTLAHAIGARILKQRLGLDTLDEDAEIREYRRRWKPEMEKYAEGYADHVWQAWQTALNAPGALPPVIAVEQRLDFSRWVPEGFGTGDAVVMGAGMLKVIDLKYGKGVRVSAIGNPQMRMYALGALTALGDFYRPKKVQMTIWQPRIGNVSVDRVDTEELLDWADNILRPSAMLAWRGAGHRVAGKWCRFCKCAPSCPVKAASGGGGGGGGGNDFKDIDFSNIKT